MITDEILMLQFQAGSRESFEMLFRRHCDALYGFFRRRLANRDRAEDLSQETWMAVLQGAVRYQPRALFRTYLYGIALKLVAGEYRRKSKQESAIGIDELVSPETPESYHSIRQALAKLEDMEREVLMLREYEQLSYAEIAELLRIPVNTVRSRLFRARLALRHVLEPASESTKAQEQL